MINEVAIIEKLSFENWDGIWWHICKNSLPARVWYFDSQDGCCGQYLRWVICDNHFCPDLNDSIGWHYAIRMGCNLNVILAK